MRNVGEALADNFAGLGDWTIFSARAISGVVSRHLKINELIRVCVEVGVSSVGVIAITGTFIGMVLAVQAYNQFHMIGLDTSLGAVIHMSVVRELGPVLAAVMLAGRVGTAMAAQLATMRVTEQIDALACLGVDPVKYLVAPRFLGCLLVIPLLTVLADAMGVVGSTLISLKVYHIDSFHYWRHTANYVKQWDLLVGLGKSVIFGGVLALICCHRGFHSRPGAEGVGRAATEGFVLSFVAILVIDFILAMLSTAIATLFWPASGAKVA
ncbi:ABC-type transport system, permease component [Fimbriiglobus ruber]|uniref:ABC-type transport system, permease component n=1 Tax=Fimbriiglobus ruber TaxID=1908690 RepID=A0A225DI49_9BACT|nr:ABC-type transport system, permease component [Fimbriiglobus ruber]